ncbi:MAG: ACP S-malonyltransferase [Proteobacteria bacterium]|nr:ACP S-malonyltransferase [Pseudomonadota bacterium]
MSKQASAVIFPGQGSQRPGMGRDFYDHFPESRLVYEEASDALGWDVSNMCFSEDERMNLTEYAQPLIVATEIAMFTGIQKRFDFTPDYFGGHSLGEYAAMVAAGVLPFSDTLKIVHHRGKLMQYASPEKTGAMVAVIGDNLDLKSISRAIQMLPVDIANVNSIDQIVISGKTEYMNEAITNITELFEQKDDVRFVNLNVSAPFHSRFMATIKESFLDVLRSAKEKMISNKAVKVTCNFTGQFHSGNCEEIIKNLVMQISGTVNWRDNMKLLSGKAKVFYEIGPNRPLRNFFKTIGISCVSITSASHAMRAFDSGKT